MDNKMNDKEKKLEQQIQKVVDELAKTRQIDLEPIETDKDWWAVRLAIFYSDTAHPIGWENA